MSLLVRWTWRLLLGGAGSYDERTVLRHGVTAIQDSDEEKAAQTLLSLVPKERREPYALPRRFDARAADSRIALLGMASLAPRDLKDESPIDIAALIEQHDAAAFRRIFPGGEGLAQGPANRMLLAGSGAARKELDGYVFLHYMLDSESPVLLSHAIPPRAAHALSTGDVEGFLLERKAAVEEAVNRLGERLAAWSRSDRPTIHYLLEQAEIEA